MTDASEYILLIDGGALVANFKPIIGRKPYTVGDLGAIELSFDGEFLEISGRKFGVRVKAKGSWPKPVIVAPGPFLQTLKRIPPKPDIYCIWSGNLSIPGRIVPGDCRLES